MTFSGFPEAAITFYEGLEVDNSRDHWLAHKGVYESAVRGPMLELCDELADRFGEARLFRPNRDIRFSADKSPYKTHQGAYSGRETGFGCYVQISADGLAAGGGFRAHGTAQTARYRAAVDAPASGLVLEKLIGRLRAEGFEVLGDAVATAPRGYPRDHPRIALLRQKELLVIKHFGVPEWLSTARTRDEVAGVWTTIAPLNAWIGEHVAGA